MNIMEFILGHRDGSQTGVQLATARRVLEQLLHSSSQGRGIGTLLSYLELSEATAKPQTGLRALDEGVFASILDNAKASRDWLTNMESALAALTSDVKLGRVSGGELAEKVTGVLDENLGIRNIRKHILAVEIGRGAGEVFANANVMGDVLQELVLNAFKYSPPGSLVRVSAGFRAGYFELQVENPCENPRMSRTQAQKEAGKSLMQPFFKLDNQIDDRYAAYGYGIGIGLTIAEYQTRQMHGTLEILEKQLQENPGLSVRVAFPSISSKGDYDVE